MMNDTLANALSTIMNENQLIGEFKKTESRQGNYLDINLLNNINKCGVIKPRHSVKKNNYEKFEKRFLPAKGFGFLIVSSASETFSTLTP